MCGTAENEIALGYVITFPNVPIKSADTVKASVNFFLCDILSGKNVLFGFFFTSDFLIACEYYGNRMKTWNLNSFFIN